MSTPVKPWENMNPSFQGFNNASLQGLNNAPPGIGNSYTEKTIPVYSLSNPHASGNRVGNMAPTIPPRLNNATQRTLRTGYAPYGSGYSSYGTGYSSYGGYGGYGSYGGYGGFGGYGSYGYGPGFSRFNNSPMANSPENQFIQLAEESARPAFQSIESLVNAFGSVAFMMDSTFNAVYSSFRAVLGVADNFGRLRSLFAQMFASITVIRWFRWFFKKILYTLHLTRMNPNSEDIWEKASGSLEAIPNHLSDIPQKPGRSNLPIFLFMGIVFSGPYLLWKLLKSLNVAGKSMYDAKQWYAASEVPFRGQVLYGFQAQIPEEVSVKAGDVVKVAPLNLQPYLNKGWMLVQNTKGDVGFVPQCYIQEVKLVRPNPNTVPQNPSMGAPPNPNMGAAPHPNMGAYPNPIMGAYPNPIMGASPNPNIGNPRNINIRAPANPNIGAQTADPVNPNVGAPTTDPINLNMAAPDAVSPNTNVGASAGSSMVSSSPQLVNGNYSENMQHGTIPVSSVSPQLLNTLPPQQSAQVSVHACNPYERQSMPAANSDPKYSFTVSQKDAETAAPQSVSFSNKTSNVPKDDLINKECESFNEQTPLQNVTGTDIGSIQSSKTDPRITKPICNSDNIDCKKEEL